MRKEVAKILDELGVPLRNKGYTYVLDAVELYEKEDTYCPYMMHIYDSVAKKNDTTPSRVERAIRHALQSTFMDKCEGHDALARCYNDKKQNSNRLAYIYRLAKERLNG